MIQTMNTWHTGHDVSKDKPTELLVFYSGAKNVPTTIPYNEENKNKCSK